MRSTLQRRGFSSVSIRALALIVTLALTAAPARAGDPIVWSLDGPAEQHGGLLTLSICGDFVSWQATAAWVAPVQGTVILHADYAGTGSTTFHELHVTAGGQIVTYQSGAPCGSTPCSASLEPIVGHLLAGQSLVIQLDDPETRCQFGPPGTSTVTFHDISFVPDVGFIPGAGALDGSVLATAKGPAANSFLGEAVALLNDIDGDGHADAAASGSGVAGPDYVRFLSGATGATLFDALEAPGVFEDFGERLATVGDVDGDGRFDVIAGRQFGTGPARVLSGADGHVLLSIPAPEPSDWFARAVGAAGDLDGDGVPDVLVGAPLSDLGGLNSGAARAYSGATGALLLAVPGAPGDRAGEGVASAGDVNGDGVPDLIVGSGSADVGATDNGAIRVHSGADGALIHELPGPVPSSTNWGSTLAGAGDLDGDGVGDVIAADWTVDLGGSNAGLVRAWSGATGALLFELIGDEYDRVGETVCAAGDWDGDGRDDVAIGSGAGYVFVVSGATHEVLEQIVLAGTGDAVISGTGGPTHCAGGADVDGDGRFDFAVGMPSANFGGFTGHSGKVVFISGDPADHVPPTLTGTGALLPSTPLTLHLVGGDAFAPVFLIASAFQANLPFKGGLLVPTPMLIVNFALNGAGAANLPATWPSGIPSGSSLWLQAWIVDSDGPVGVVASAALQIITP